MSVNMSHLRNVSKELETAFDALSDRVKKVSQSRRLGSIPTEDVIKKLVSDAKFTLEWAKDVEQACKAARKEMEKDDNNKEHRRVSRSARKQEADSEGKGHWTCPQCSAEGTEELEGTICTVCGMKVQYDQAESKKPEAKLPTVNSYGKALTKHESIISKSLSVTLKG